VPDATDAAALDRAGRRDAKAPDVGFTPDARTKQAVASPEQRMLAQRHLASAVDRLRQWPG
jgi:hypothetical protein